MLKTSTTWIGNDAAIAMLLWWLVSFFVCYVALFSCVTVHGECWMPFPEWAHNYRSELVEKHFKEFIGIHKPFIENGYIPQRDEVSWMSENSVNRWAVMHTVWVHNMKQRISYASYEPFPHNHHGPSEPRASGLVALSRNYFPNGW